MPGPILEALASGLRANAAGDIRHMVTMSHKTSSCSGDCEALSNNALRLMQDPLLALLSTHNVHEALEAVQIDRRSTPLAGSL